MPEAWPRDAASPSQFSGNYSYIRNLRRSLPKGTSTLHPLEGAMGTLCQAAMLKERVSKSWIPKSQTRGTPSLPSRTSQKTPLQASSKLAIID